jgi:phosphocarrier protein
MLLRTVKIRNRAGLHTRPAAMIVKKAAQYRCEFFIDKEGYRINGKSIIGVMTLAAEPGSELVFECDGADAPPAAVDIVDYFERGFDEEM